MKRTGKLITLVLVVAMALSLMSVAALAADSSDYEDVVAGKWYVQYVDWALDEGLMTGISDKEWAPNTATTRGMVITTLYALAGKPEVEGDSPFADVEEGKYYTDAVKWAVEAGVASGKSGDKFDPTGVLTREEAATFFCAFAKNVWKLDVSDTSGMNKFPDKDDVSNYAKDAMGWAVKAEVISGSKENNVVKLMPKRDITRAELATMLKALKEHEPKPVIPTPDEIGYGTVVVTVKATDNALKGHVVELTGKDNDNNEIALKGTTDAKGIVTFDNVPASSEAGYEAVVTNADARYGEQAPVTGIAVTPKETTNVTINLSEQGGNVTVTLSATEDAQAERAIVDGVKVTIVGETNDGQSYSQTKSTDSKGVVTFTKVPSGKYTVLSLYENGKLNDDKDYLKATGNSTYKDLALRYDAPRAELSASSVDFEVVNGDVAVATVLDLKTNYFEITASVVAGDEYAVPEDKNGNPDLSGYQFRVTGTAKNGTKVDIASNYTENDGTVVIENVPESAKGEKYTVELLNAKSWQKTDPNPASFKVAVKNDIKLDPVVLSTKTGLVEIKVMNIKDSSVVRDGVKVNLHGFTDAGVAYQITAEDTDNDGFVVFKDVPFSAKGYDIYVEGDKYAVAKNSTVVVDTTKKIDAEVYLTTEWKPVKLTLVVSSDNEDLKPTSDGYYFQLNGTTKFGETITMTALEETAADGTYVYAKVPYGEYNVSVLDLGDYADLTFRADNEVALNPDNSTSNAMLIVDDSEHVNPVKGIVYAKLHAAKELRVTFMYRGVEIQGVNFKLTGVPTYLKAKGVKQYDTVEYTTAYQKAIKKYCARIFDVPAGTYQIKDLSFNPATDNNPAYVGDLWVYDIAQGQKTYVAVDNEKLVELVVELSTDYSKPNK